MGSPRKPQENFIPNFGGVFAHWGDLAEGSRGKIV